MYKKSFMVILMSFVSFFAFTPEEYPQIKGIDSVNLDTSILPAANFYDYANGGWIKNNPIPEDQSRWSNFEVLNENNLNTLKTILDELAGNQFETGSIRQKVSDFYKIGMDTARIEKENFRVILPELKKIDIIKDQDSFIKMLAEMQRKLFNPLFTFSSAPDSKNSNMNLAYLYQGGLGLPDRDYYLNQDDKSKEIREKYKEYIASLFNNLGLALKSGREIADTILTIETRLAKASNSRLENRDPIKTYNKMDIDSLYEIAGNFDWDFYFEELGISDPEYINVAQPGYFKELNKMMKEVRFDNWSLYIKYHFLRASASYLNQDFVNSSFDFYSRYLNGVTEMQPRWKRILETINSKTGELLGQLYVEKAFPPESKEKAEDIVRSLLESMKERIENLTWMTTDTKEKALEKLSTFKYKIGYPDKWTDFSSLGINNDSYIRNIMRINEFYHKRSMNDINNPVDRSRWYMSPQTVNAYYSPKANEIVFPAGILQFPFFDASVDDAINYGAMGVVIGHEITHGFDDQGRKYDAEGNITDWWTSEDQKNFTELTDRLAEQFSGYSPVEGYNIDGKLTLGENIADLGGIAVSLNAFKKTEQYNKGELIDGFTPVQRFFLSYAQVWRNNIREQALILRLKTDVHSPAKYRVLGPLKNNEDFHKAFGINETDPMGKPAAELIKIW